MEDDDGFDEKRLKLTHTKKKVKNSHNIPLAVGGDIAVAREALAKVHTGCMFWMERKRRFCNLARVRKLQFCGNHVNGGTHGAASSRNGRLINTNNKGGGSESGVGRARIPCPVDPTHTIFEYNVKMHLRICNKMKTRRELEAMPYFRLNANSGSLASPSSPSSVAERSGLELLARIEALFAEHVGNSPSAAPPSASASAAAAAVVPPPPPPPPPEQQQKDSRSERQKGISLEFKLAEGCDEYLAASAAPSLGEASRRSERRSLVQQSSIVASLERRRLLARRHQRVCGGSYPNHDAPPSLPSGSSAMMVDPVTGEPFITPLPTQPLLTTIPTTHHLSSCFCFVELGAGRGTLSLAVRSAVGPAAPLVLVERNPVRNKADRDLRKLNQTGEEKQHQQQSQLSSSASSSRNRGSQGRSNFVRARVDIRDLDMSGLPFSGGEEGSNDRLPVVTIAKHLCGVATDLGLRALKTRRPAITTTTSTNDGAAASSGTKASSSDRDTDGDLWPGRGESAGAEALDVAGVCIATCCHHCCTWKDYTAKGFFQDTLGLGPADFARMCRWSGWACHEAGLPADAAADQPLLHATATAKAMTKPQPPAITSDVLSLLDFKAPMAEPQAVPSGPSDAAAATNTAAGKGGDNAHRDAVAALLREDPERRRRVGRMCKRLIDLGRIEYLRSLGLSAEIVHYCPPEVSPENALILAWREREN